MPCSFKLFLGAGRAGLGRGAGRPSLEINVQSNTTGEECLKVFQTCSLTSRPWQTHSLSENNYKLSKSKTCCSSESNHIYIILKASVNIMVAFEEMIWFMEGINVSSPISLNLLWSLRLSLIYHFKKKKLRIGIMKVWRAISMNETSILLRDIYVAVNQLSNWRCFDSKVSHKSSA